MRVFVRVFTIMFILFQIVNRYDLILIQEIRDKDESSLIKLRDMLQR